MSNSSNISRPLVRDGTAGFEYLLKFSDALCVLLAACFAYFTRFGELSFEVEPRYVYASCAGALLVLVCFSELGVYRSWRYGQRTAMYARLLLGWVLTLLVLTMLSFLSKTSHGYSRLWFAYWSAYGFFVMIVCRLLLGTALGHLRRSGRGMRQVVLIGPMNENLSIKNRLDQAPVVGYRAVAVSDPNKEAMEDSENMLPYRDLKLWLQSNLVNEVWLTFPMRDEQKIRESMEMMSDLAVNIRWVPDFFAHRLVNHGVTEMAGLAVVDLSVTPIVGINRLVKEVEDRVISSLALLFLSPVMIALAIGVKLSSPGPVFYRQERVGWNGRPFEMIKFRSMPVNTEQAGVKWGNADKKTVTKFGKFIRKTSLDELPQFINVLKGDMSIVGPRPERTVFVDQFKETIPNYMQKHMVKAGITGWAQVNGLRGDTDLNKRVEYDLHYIEHWSVWFDLRIILQTALLMFFDKKAY